MNKPSNVVLVIDDEPKIRRFLRAGFELHGFSVVEAENGASIRLHERLGFSVVARLPEVAWKFERWLDLVLLQLLLG